MFLLFVLGCIVLALAVSAGVRYSPEEIATGITRFIHLSGLAIATTVGWMIFIGHVLWGEDRGETFLILSIVITVTWLLINQLRKENS